LILLASVSRQLTASRGYLMMVEHGADYDDPAVDDITQLLCEAEDSDWISDYDTRHKEEL